MSNLPPSSAADIVSGLLAGTILAALVGYGLWLAVIPVAKANAGDLKKALGVLTALLTIKVIALSFFPGFQIDVGTYEAWALQLVRGGPASMYQSGFFLDYPPGYLYALWAAGAIAHALGANGDLLHVLIGFPALLADIALSILIFALMYRCAGKPAAWVGMLLFAFNPALLFDTVVWSQSDSAFTLMMLLSAMMLMDEKVEAAFGLAALAVMIKPQAVSLLPVLLTWTLIRVKARSWPRAALAFIAITLVTVAPFQVGHAWDWLPNLYISSAAYYHETSVNAFNFLALLGGLRVSDSTRILGYSYFAIGITLILALYAFALWLLARNPVRRNLFFSAFIVVFGFFMFAPRMHERYAYPAVVFAIPLVFDGPLMAAVFLLLTLTCLSNLVAVLHILEISTFLARRDSFAMVISLVNLFTFSIAAAYWYATRAGTVTVLSFASFEKWFFARSAGAWKARAARILGAADFSPLEWLTIDTIAMISLVGAAAALRFWNLGHPAEIVFDEVHFVGQARHYIRAEPFLDPHPPIAKLLIAAGILIFGDHPASWRLANAVLGTTMVAVTYLLGRLMFRSRLAANLAAGLIAFDGLFIVDSRIGCIDIVYLTFAAIAYLLMFRIVGSRDLIQRRGSFLIVGIVLGLVLGSKLYVPAITFLLVTGFLLVSMWLSAAPGPTHRPALRTASRRQQFRLTAGAGLIIGSVSGMLYLASFLPHYALGWWGGMSDLLHYYKDVMWYENSVATATHPYASPWWSWPLMLRPVAYWQNFPLQGKVALIWGAGNPLTWWAVAPAMIITAVRTVRQPDFVRLFLVFGFMTYFLIWVPITRILFLYHYLPSLYIGYLALAGILAETWHGKNARWESFVLLLSMMPVLLIGPGHIAYEYGMVSGHRRMMVGLTLGSALLISYLVLDIARLRPHRFVFIAFISLAIALFSYYLPVWLAIPISRTGYYARMWLQGPNPLNWI